MVANIFQRNINLIPALFLSLNLDYNKMCHFYILLLHDHLIYDTIFEILFLLFDISSLLFLSEVNID